jgi:hypothetical protein
MVRFLLMAVGFMASSMAMGLLIGMGLTQSLPSIKKWKSVTY